MKNKMKKMINDNRIELAVRWALGVLFVFASIHKITDPAGFAKILYGYKLFPGEIINLLAIVMPFIELISGMALLAGIWPRSAAIIINSMLFAFIVAISINLIRGHEFDCGCFAVGENNLNSSSIQLLIRDIVWFFCGLFVIFFRKERKFILGF